MTLFFKAVIVVLCLANLGSAAPAKPTSALATQPARLSAEDQRRFRDLVDLLKEQNTPKARRTGARELLQRGWPQAVEVLFEVLGNEKDPMAQMAVIDVIAESAKPSARFIDPLVRLLDSKDEKIRDVAADALARYDKGGVVEGLSRLARGGGDPPPGSAMRVAAIRALSQFSDRREAMEALMTLLEDPNPDVRVKATQAIGDAAGVDFGTDIQAIHKWWKVDRERSDLLRSRDRYLVKIRQNRSVRMELERVRNVLVATLRKLYLRMPDAQKTNTLMDYLEDTMADVRLLGLELVNALVTDRKAVPEAVLNRIRLMVADHDPKVRRESALTLRDFHNAADAKLILAQYELETDGTVRAAMLNALGRLGAPEAIRVIIEALSSDDKQVAAEGALALAVLREEGHVSADKIVPAVKPLKMCYGKLTADDGLLREQFLEAMARISDPQFGPIFKDGLDVKNDAAVRQAAARGIAALGKSENARLLIDHLADPDPGVRRTVVDALARIAEPEHLEALSSRLDAKSESDATVRTKAWEGVYQILRGLPVDEQRRWITTRLDSKADKASAERYVEVMTEIEKQLAAETPLPTDLPAVREQLGDGLRDAGQFAEAARVYKLAHDTMAKVNEAKAWDVGLKLFDAQLQADRNDEATVLAESLRDSANRQQRDKLAGVLGRHLEALLEVGEPDKALEVLRHTDKRYGDAWSKKFSKLRKQAEQLRREKNVATVRRCLAQLRGDADDVERAQQDLQSLGPRAILPLVEELRAVLMADEADPVREQHILRQLMLLVPRWQGYPDRTDKDSKLEALDQLIQLSASTVGK